MATITANQPLPRSRRGSGSGHSSGPGSDAIRIAIKHSSPTADRNTTATTEPSKKPSKSKRSHTHALSSLVEPVRQSTFLARVVAQQWEQQRHLGRRQQQLQQLSRDRDTSGTIKWQGFSSIATTPARAPSASRLKYPRPAQGMDCFAVDLARLGAAPDGLHYIEGSGKRTVISEKDDAESWAPLSVLLVHRCRRHRANAANADRPTDGQQQDQERDAEVVMVRHVPVVDILAAVQAQVAGADTGIRGVHDGREGLTSMHLEVDEDFSFMPASLKARQWRKPPVSPDVAATFGEDSEKTHSSGRDASATDLPLWVTAQWQPGTEPTTYDYFIPPTMRAMELLKAKHEGGLRYLKHKLTYSKSQLEEMSREDRRNYLTCERRFLFMRQLQRDLTRRLENDLRVRRRQARERRAWGRLHPNTSSISNANNGGQAGDSAGLSLYTTEGSGHIDFHGNNLYVVGREIPPELVQTFFSLNEEYEAFQRSLGHQQQQQQHNRGGSGGASAMTGTGRPKRPTPRNANTSTDVANATVRWGDALLFGEQRPVDGLVVVTAGPRGMRGWRRVLTGDSGRAAHQQQRQRQQQGEGQRRANSNRHIDLYTMAQRTAMNPNEPTQPSSDPVYTITTQGTTRTGRIYVNPREPRAREADDADEFAYTRHFRYQLFYANESDLDSDGDLLCGEAEEAVDAQRPRVPDGPVSYGQGYYLPRT